MQKTAADGTRGLVLFENRERSRKRLSHSYGYLSSACSKGLKIMKETLILSDYKITTEMESNIIPGVMVKIYNDQISCPRCEIELSTPHGKEVRCVCNLNMQAWGNVLYIWK